RREREEIRRVSATGAYFRLVREPDATAKLNGFKRALARLRDKRPDPAIYHTRQGDFDAIPSAPWVYWITPGLRQLFQKLPKLGEIAELLVGCFTCDNPRFLRYWWEVGFQNIEFGCSSLQDVHKSHKAWFPHMKGGGFRRWWGNQEYVIYFPDDGREIREHRVASGQSAALPGYQFYLHQGVTWSRTTSKSISARFMPPGFIFDVEAASAFYSEDKLLLGLLNSSVASKLLSFINPTIHLQSGDLKRLPIPIASSEILGTLVERAVSLARAESAEDETTHEFSAPPAWPNGGEDVAAHTRELVVVEQQIDEEVYRLYDISDEDRRAIEAELAGQSLAGDDADEDDANEAELDSTVPSSEDDGAAANGAGGLSRQALAARWVSYAVGIVLGRYRPGEAGALGQGRFAQDVAIKLQALAVPDGISVLDPGHEADLVVLVERALALLVGEEQVEPLLAAATGGRPLADWLTRDYFKQHVQQYRKRPIYWLLQSPKKRYSLYLFHERVTGDTLHLLQGSNYLGGRINRARKELTERRRTLMGLGPGTERRRLEGDVETREKDLADLETFAKTLATVTAQTNERGAVVGWAPEPDDGVLINLAPLFPLLPAWSAEPKQCWEALAHGTYDWSHTAMRYWPNRVLTACEKNPSFAIAHGLKKGS
ncbi:MAG TPA: hypothetical protein VH593_34570, partial [Ktedonobacteraceae bacterium]